MDPAQMKLKQEYDVARATLKPEDCTRVDQLLKSTCESLKLQFSAKQQYKGEAIHGIIDKHLELLTRKDSSQQEAKSTRAETSSSVARDSSQTKQATTSASVKPTTDGNLSKDAINKNLDALSAGALGESLQEEVAVKQTSQGTGRAQPPTEQKVVKAANSGQSSEVGSVTTGLSEAELNSVLDAFEFNLTGKVGGEPPEAEVKEEVLEEHLKPGKVVVTGYRGNPYYEEELRKAVQDSMEGEGNESKPPSGPATKPATDPVKPENIKVPSDPGKPTRPPGAICAKPAQPPQNPAASQDSNTGKQQTIAEKSSTGLSKEEINKTLDIFESSLAGEVPDFKTNTEKEEREVMHMAKSQSTNAAKPPTAEDKVTKMSSTQGATSLSKDEITSALDAFEAGLGDDFGTSLVADKLVADIRDPKETKETVVKEEELKPGKATRTGYRGNPYYEEELRRAVEESMEGEGKDSKPSAKPVTGGHKDPSNPAAPASSTVPPTASVGAPTSSAGTPSASAAAPAAKPAAASSLPGTVGQQKTEQKQQEKSSAGADKAPAQPNTSSTQPKNADVNPGADAKESAADKTGPPLGEPTEKKAKSNMELSHNVAKPTDKKQTMEIKDDQPAALPKAS